MSRSYRQTDRKGSASHLSEISLEQRRKNPTSFENGKLALKQVATRKRRNKTYLAAKEVHGGSQNSPAIGLVDTAVSKCSPNVLVDVLSSKKEFNKNVFPTIYKRHLSTYESSEENMIRSISIYYSGSIADKQKYRKVYKNSFYKINNSSSKNRVRLSVHECPIPRLVPYHKLMLFIKSIPIGNLNSVYSTHCDGRDEDEKVFGCYRSLKDCWLVLQSSIYLGIVGIPSLGLGRSTLFM